MSSANMNRKIEVGLAAWREKGLATPRQMDPEEIVTTIVEAIERMPLRGEDDDTREWVVPIKDPTHCEYGDEIARAALTAAAPYIAAQAMADLRTRIAALRDEWRDNAATAAGADDMEGACMYTESADALGALLREEEEK